MRAFLKNIKEKQRLKDAAAALTAPEVQPPPTEVPEDAKPQDATEPEASVAVNKPLNGDTFTGAVVESIERGQEVRHDTHVKSVLAC